MPVVSFKCPNCDGPLTFDPETGKYTCDYCEGVFTQETLDALAKKEAAKKEEAHRNDEGAVVYTCPSCGAEIVTTATTAATFCYYCHNPVILSGRVSADWQPDEIVPFTVDREQAVAKFLAFVGRKKFVPRNFFRREQIEKLTGIYYPYWVAEYTGNATFSGQGTKVATIRRGQDQVVTTSTYRVERGGSFDYRGLIRPALKAADRRLDSNIHPFNLEEAKPFSMGYLSGFLAERRDVESRSLEPELNEEVENYCDARFRSEAVGYATLSGNTAVEIRERKFRYVLLPSWILTYKGGDGKTYYYAMNGQTGTVCGDLPLAKKRLFLLCAGIAFAVTVTLLMGGWLLW